MGNVIYLSDHIDLSSSNEVFTSTDANRVKMHVHQHSKTKEVAISLVNDEGEAIEIYLSAPDVLKMFRALIPRK